LSHKPDGLHIGIVISSGLEMRRAVVERRIDVLSNLSIMRLDLYIADSMSPNCLNLIETASLWSNRNIIHLSIR